MLDELRQEYRHTLKVLTAFPRQEWLRERVFALCYTYIDCLVCVLSRELPVCYSMATGDSFLGG